MAVTAYAKEEGTFVVNVAPEDEDDNPVIPVTARWTLTDSEGNVINNRLHVSLTPAYSMDIVLQGDDLAIPGSSKSRILTVEATYNSSLGNDLPLNDDYHFIVDNMFLIEEV